ncbi:helix-turn-helix domain-containing protein [Pseudomonas sp. S 311-6]|uniref:helix-turn-helix domain-containing protein n=1 Tax=Kerstersia gyiorum TaxID=206506 RepID=UPI002098164C|nr:helix-turn-helix domain-containing protein [Pseudomonas sp. S 311-6]
MTKFGQRLRDARLEAGYSQKQAADRAGMAQSTLSALETGEQPTSTFIPRLATLYRVSIRWLLDGVRNEEEGASSRLPLTPEQDDLLDHYDSASEAQRRLAQLVLRRSKEPVPEWAEPLAGIVDGLVAAVERTSTGKTE